jgi:hypothetical protein
MENPSPKPATTFKEAMETFTTDLQAQNRAADTIRKYDLLFRQLTEYGVAQDRSASESHIHRSRRPRQNAHLPHREQTRGTSVKPKTERVAGFLLFPTTSSQGFTRSGFPSKTGAHRAGVFL